MTKSLALAAALGLALAGCHHPDPKDPKTRERAAAWAQEHVADVLEDVDATDAQRAKLAGLERPVVDEAFRLYDGHEAAKAALAAEWRAPQASAERVHAVIDERVEGLRRLLYVTADAALRAHDALDVGQRAAIAERAGCE